MAVEAFITGTILRWARERAGLTLAEGAERLHVREDRLASWENEEARPSLAQAQDAARRLNIPFGYLYYKELPDVSLPVPDLRTVANARVLLPSPDLAATVNDALDKQDWYREYLEEFGSEPLEYIGSFSIQDEPQIIAEAIRERLGITEEFRRRAANWEQFLTEFVRLAERHGILVLRNGVVGNNTRRVLNVEEFRGFALADSLAPLVFINSRDAKSAQIFTLAHEIAHLWVGKSGVSNPDYRKRSNDEANSTEQLTNRVAAELLVPANDLMSRWNESESTEANVQRLAPRYRVSRFVVLRQAYDVGLIAQESYWGVYESYLADTRTTSSGSGGDFFTNALARNSAQLTSVLLSAVAEGRASYIEAARLLNVKTGTLAGIADHLRPGAA